MFSALNFMALVGLGFGWTASGWALEDGKGKKGQAAKPDVLFQRVDSNQDGKISQEEFRQFREKMKTRLPARGKALPGQGEGDRLFRHLDTNHDGFLSKAEFQKGREKLAAHRKPGKAGKNKSGA